MRSSKRPGGISMPGRGVIHRVGPPTPWGVDNFGAWVGSFGGRVFCPSPEGVVWGYQLNDVLGAFGWNVFMAWLRRCLALPCLPPSRRLQVRQMTLVLLMSSRPPCE